MIGMALFANPVPIGKLLGDKDGSHTWAIVVCLSSLWIFNIGLNVVQASGT